jgi:hypothetical protein
MSKAQAMLFCSDCGAVLFPDGGWIVDHDGQEVGLCGDCVKRYRHDGGGPVRIGVTIPKVLAAIKGYMTKGKRSRKAYRKEIAMDGIEKLKTRVSKIESAPVVKAPPYMEVVYVGDASEIKPGQFGVIIPDRAFLAQLQRDGVCGAVIDCKPKGGV